MIPRGQLSISFVQLFRALAFSFTKRKKEQINPDPYYGRSIFCLSVRTGLDLTLQSLNFAEGSEVLVTNINIPDMFAILDAHGLISKPISLNKHTLNISTKEAEAMISPLTKAILVTHLFGGIMEMGPIILLAKKYNLIVIEDCAQAFDFTYRGNPESAIVLFSFGLIKTNTCLTGAMVSFNDEVLFTHVAQLNAKLPKQRTRRYISKIFKAIAIKLITQKWSYTLLYRCTKVFKKDFDQVLAGFTKGFPGDDVMSKISFQPCNANLRMLQLRTKNIDLLAITKRKALAKQILQKIPSAYQIGVQNPQHSYWVLPIESENPTQLIVTLRDKGIDATAKASSLISINGSHKLYASDELQLEKLIYLPIDVGMLNKVIC